MPKTGRRPGRPDTRGEIVAAAARCFAKAGYDATSTRQVAADAGVDPALVRRFFGGKQHGPVATDHRESLPPSPLRADHPVGDGQCPRKRARRDRVVRRNDRGRSAQLVGAAQTAPTAIADVSTVSSEIPRRQRIPRNRRRPPAFTVGSGYAVLEQATNPCR